MTSGVRFEDYEALFDRIIADMRRQRDPEVANALRCKAVMGFLGEVPRMLRIDHSGRVRVEVGDT